MLYKRRSLILKRAAMLGSWSCPPFQVFPLLFFLQLKFSPYFALKRLYRGHWSSRTDWLLRFQMGFARLALLFLDCLSCALSHLFHLFVLIFRYYQLIFVLMVPKCFRN